MPKELWAEGVRLARDLGACRVARAVGMDYMGLRRKIARADERTNEA
jgi:2-hydroxychromene-2-carboxylate isomerase